MRRRHITLADKSLYEGVQPGIHPKLCLMGLRLQSGGKSVPDGSRGLIGPRCRAVALELGGEGFALDRLQENLERFVDQRLIVLGDFVRGAERRFDRLKTQEAIGEAVNRSYVGRVETSQGFTELTFPGRTGLDPGELRQQTFPDTKTQLSGGLPRERDGGDAGDRNRGRGRSRRGDHFNEATHEDRRLPGAFTITFRSRSLMAASRWAWSGGVFLVCAGMVTLLP